MAPGLSTRDPNDEAGGLYAHEHTVVQEVILHAMYWVVSRAPIERFPPRRVPGRARGILPRLSGRSRNAFRGPPSFVATA